MKILRTLSGNALATVEIKATLISKYIWLLLAIALTWTLSIESWFWFWVTFGVGGVLTGLNFKYWLVRYVVCRNKGLVLKYQEATSNTLGVSTLILTVRLRGKGDGRCR